MSPSYDCTALETNTKSRSQRGQLPDPRASFYRGRPSRLSCDGTGSLRDHIVEIRCRRIDRYRSGTGPISLLFKQ
jgi:hypothetical protein